MAGGPEADMRLFGIVEPFFHALSDGKLIRLTVAWVLRIVAGLGALGGLLWFVIFIGLGFKASDTGFGSQSAGFLIGCLVFSIFGLALGYLWLGICMFRARSVLELGDSHFTVLSILSILFRLYGELGFVTYSLLGVGGCLFVWFSNVSPLSELGAFASQLPFAQNEATGFVGGIELAVLMLLIAFAVIVVCYALAELSVVFVEIALNTRGIPALTMPIPSLTPVIGVAAPAPVQQTPAAIATPVAVRNTTCKQCGANLDEGAGFCAECGTAAG